MTDNIDKALVALFVGACAIGIAVVVHGAWAITAELMGT